MSRAARAPTVTAIAGATLFGVTLLVAMGACRESSGMRRQSVPGGDPDRGREALVSYGCGSCHVIPGVPAADGLVGPPLTGFADRSYIAGQLHNEPGTLVAWIQNPPGFAPGTAMPVLGVTPGDARDIAAYLYTLGADGLGPPHLIPVRVIPGH